MAATNANKLKQLRQQNTLLREQNVNLALAKSQDVLNSKAMTPQTIGVIQSALKAGISAPRSVFPTIDLSISQDLPAMDKASIILQKAMTGVISADHATALTQSLIAIETLKQDLRFNQRVQAFREHIGVSEAALIDRVNELEHQLELERERSH